MKKNILYIIVVISLSGCTEWHAKSFPVSITAQEHLKDSTIISIHWINNQLWEHWQFYCAAEIRADCNDMPHFLEYKDRDATVFIREQKPEEQMQGPGEARPLTSPLGTIMNCEVRLRSNETDDLEILIHEIGHCALGFMDLYDDKDKNNVMFWLDTEEEQTLEFWQAEELFDYYFLLRTMPPIAYR